MISTLPVVFGQYEKERFGIGVINVRSAKLKDEIIHGFAVLDCLVRADA
jgi:hypothetical protein